jgi:metallo-beta-lactamase family protein
MAISITCHGAAQTVTGSMHLIRTDHGSILLDCGMFQGRRKESRERNENMSDELLDADAVILSHAHIDHSGNLPTLFNRGFQRKVYMTDATRELCWVMLQDAAHIQEQDVYYLNKRAVRRKERAVYEPLYRLEDVLQAFRFFRDVEYHTPFQPINGVTAQFFDAGHILGSASVVLDIEDEGTTKRLVFSGDIGRWNASILRDPEIPEGADYVIMESTYGGREREELEDVDQEVADMINRVYNRSGKIIVPSFALERTQEFVYILSRLRKEGKIPDVKVYVDSPLAVNVTQVFSHHPECFDEETLAFLRGGDDPFGSEHVRYIRDVEHSKRLNTMEGPAIIISASGMCEFGRIVHHLKNHIEDKRNMVLIIGYQAGHTLGRRIVERRETVRIFGDEYRLNAEVVVMNAFSAHADRSDLYRWIEGVGPQVQDVVLVHGDPRQMEAFAPGLKERGYRNVHMPQRAQRISVS